MIDVGIRAELFGGAGYEIADDGIDGDTTPGDEDAGLSSRPESRFHSPREKIALEGQRGEHLADTAIRPDRQEAVARTSSTSADGEYPLGIAHVVQSPAQQPGSVSQLGNRAQACVQSVRDVQTRVECAAQRHDPVFRQHSTRVDDADDQRSRAGGDGLLGRLRREPEEVPVIQSPDSRTGLRTPVDDPGGGLRVRSTRDVAEEEQIRGVDRRWAHGDHE